MPILTLAFYLFTVAVLIGLVLSLFHLGLMRWRWWPGVVHGAFGATGLAVLFFSLGGPPRGVEYGVQSFGTIAAAIAAAALLIGLTFLAFLIFAKKKVSWLVGAHVTVGITAYFFLMAYVLIG